MGKPKMSELRERFPMYADLSDDQFLIGFRKKFYSDIPPEKFYSLIELDTERQRLGAEQAGGMSKFDQLLAGWGKSIADVGRGAGQMVGAVSREDVAESRQRDAPLMNTGMGMTGNIAGNVATLAPLALVPGANTLLGGTALGGALGLAAPSTSGKETLDNVGLGALGGAIVPVVTRAWRTGKAALEPFSKKGQEAIVGRAIERAAGSDGAAVRQRLQEAAKPFVGPQQGIPKSIMGEIVPGSVPTVGQAAESAGVASLERAATATNPNVTNAVNDIMRAQNTARVGVLDDLAGAGGKREFFEADLAATGDKLYGAARKKGIPQNKMTPAALENIEKFRQRVPESIMNDARAMAKVEGLPLDDTTSIQGLHYVKMAIDDAIGAAKKSGNATLARSYTKLQQDLLTGMDKLSPAYAKARKTFAEMARPVNQMEVAGAIRDRSVAPLTGQLQPAAFARALNDKTAASALRMPSATLEKVMEPQQLSAFDAVLRDVQRSNFAQNAGRGTGSDTVQKLAYTNLLDEAGVPSFIREMKPAQMIGGLLGRTSDVAYARANRELSEMIAEIMLDPGRAAAVMSRATPTQRQAIQQALTRAGSGLGLALPAAANARQ